MKKNILWIVIVFLWPFHVHALDINNIKPAFKQEPITNDDLISFLNLNIYKYKLRIPSKHSINIILNDITNNRTIFNHSPKINDAYDYIMTISFTREDDIPGDAFESEHNTLNYSVNWNYNQVFSGTISNFLKNQKNRILEINSNDFGEIISDKISIIKFYTWDGSESKEKLVAELYLTLQTK